MPILPTNEKIKNQLLEKEFIRLITEHQGIILKVCKIYCSNSQDSEDLFQEITLQLWRAFPTFKGTAKFTTWMYLIALNTAITTFRRKKRWRWTQHLEKVPGEIPDNAPPRLDIEYEQKLTWAISQLNKFDKALVLLYLEEKSYEEMADIMGISESNIGVKINRIKKKLKVLFQG